MRASLNQTQDLAAEQPRPTARTLIVISARLDSAGREAVAAGRWPRKDFFELAAALEADVIDHATVEERPHWRLLRRGAGVAIAQAWVAYVRRGRYERVFTDGEHIGIPLAALLRFSRRAPRHITIGHLLSTPAKRAMFRWLRPQRHLDAVMLHATAQQRFARERLGLSAQQTPLVAYQIDPDFWTPRDLPAEDVICSVGLEYRDYPTMIEAVRGLPLRAVIAAGSRWSTHRNNAGDDDLPANVEVTRLDYEALRDLYARSRFVVVPLHDVDNQAGITVILEAMAMGKAVIVTATRGQCDVVRGRVCTAAGVTARVHGNPVAFGISGPAGEAETGLYVPPGDPAALRQAIQHLREHPDEAARMGAAGRRLVEEHMSLDLFVQRIGALLDGPRQDAAATGAGAGMRPAPTSA